ncbi:LLM class flavin-dependent oxidoreductase [Nocardia pseudobrasiliensis]|uniref:Alkanesulfonate monooxygenase SsuD/methylene tetrahydromethanopterin reductase-like flavin-dependent oxidoreductase (Luciferase family) n=1 Tax=Nocardia pseudobrasiliensis TaxID=45979 RepID=A0A370I048_9NOCA|nr:LLM class flavin-dependent oxidoreductase [Nocardia pseudobrasiliensis]RDI64112.1 alkanesulfonate monooxygenase SsuD/methylene tetrahydromethanopterin reductase-like flavin-dependent oxidoreductase (luciferase family) [Nocardia pseudobrasiliensis]
MNDIRYGLLLPSGQTQVEAAGSARGLVDLVVEVERRGFDSAWVGDSLLRTRIEPLTLLASAASVTERITLGTAVLLPAYRNPVQAALTIASLDALSRGRLILGVGGGFPGISEPEFETSGVAFKTRFSHMDDAVRLWRRLWSGNTEPFEGRILRYGWLPESPRPHRPGGPPIWLGGITPAALRRTGRLYDGWLPYPPLLSDYSDGLAAIRAESAAAGRPDDAVTPALFATVCLDEDPVRGRERLRHYAETTYGLPLETVEQIQVLITGSAEQVAAQLRRYTDAGARHILLRIAAIEERTFIEQLDRVTALLPLLTATVSGAGSMARL